MAQVSISLILAAVASSARLIWRQQHLVGPSDPNIGRTIALAMGLFDAHLQYPNPWFETYEKRNLMAKVSI